MPRHEHATVIRRQVRALLARSPGFRALPEAQQAQLADDMTRVASSIAASSDPNTTSTTVAKLLAHPDRSHRATVRADLQRAVRPRGTLESVDFPNFVAGLIEGTFQATVDASVQQMRAYAELLRDVAGSLDRFDDDDDDDD